MLKYSWNKKKNELLKEVRGISFEQIVDAINNNKVIVELGHTNPHKYKNQKLMILVINNYVYCVPFVEKDNVRFLKTIYASRKYKKLYLRRKYEKT